MLTYVPIPVYELACSGGLLYAYVAYVAYMQQCSMTIIYLSCLLSVSSVWFHCTKSAPSYWMDQLVINSWCAMFLYEAYLRSWIAVGLATIGMFYGILMFYIGMRNNTYAYHPSRFFRVFFHITVHMVSAILAIFIITLFPIPK